MPGRAGDEALPGSHPVKKEIKNLFLPEHGLEFIQEINKKAQDKYPELTPEQRAWDTLTEIEEVLG